MGTNFSFFATCPKGVEDLLQAELIGLGAEDARIGVAGVQCEGSIELGYTACLWSRLANRVLCNLAQSDPLVGDEDQMLYDFVTGIGWEEHFSPSNTFVVDFVGTTEGINNTQYGAMRVKDAIVDRFSRLVGARPSVDKNAPQIRINVRLNKNRLAVSIDLSGESLHKRGYRVATGIAPLKENLAAALLLRAGWPQHLARGGSLIDPMCGSATFLIEAAWMALDRAPGLKRTFGFERWLHHDPDIWSAVKQDALTRDKTGDPAAQGLQLWGFDNDSKVLRAAAANIKSADCSDYITIAECDVARLSAPAGANPGLIICNPPYGERLGDLEALDQTYSDLAASAKSHFVGWELAVFTGNVEAAKQMRLRPKKRNKFFNGPIASELLLYVLLSDENAKLRTDVQSESDLSEGAQMVANRLRKNMKRLGSWLQQVPSNCYRLYDADMPEYSAAVDIYDGYVHVQEYAPPKTVDAQAAEKRLRELINAVSVVLAAPKDTISIKTRKRNRGADQYQSSEIKHDQFIPVVEGKAKLLVNMHDYLDTGLFLDHRPLRLRIAGEALNKTFLNLFSYTATASVHAALGGAKSSVSVDMSNTYIQWAQKNMELNHINLHQHQLVQDDCMSWLSRCRQGFDLILLDPPTFSNSKRMDDVLDVQRDHVSLIERCMELLNPRGTLYFSNNLQSFKLDAEALSAFNVENITPDTIDEDFKRNLKIHHCFKISHLS